MSSKKHIVTFYDPLTNVHDLAYQLRLPFTCYCVELLLNPPHHFTHLPHYHKDNRHIITWPIGQVLQLTPPPPPKCQSCIILTLHVMVLQKHFLLSLPILDTIFEFYLE